MIVQTTDRWIYVSDCWSRDDVSRILLFLTDFSTMFQPLTFESCFQFPADDDAECGVCTWVYCEASLLHLSIRADNCSDNWTCILWVIHTFRHARSKACRQCLSTCTCGQGMMIKIFVKTLIRIIFSAQSCDICVNSDLGVCRSELWVYLMRENCELWVCLMYVCLV